MSWFLRFIMPTWVIGWYMGYLQNVPPKNISWKCPFVFFIAFVELPATIIHVEWLYSTVLYAKYYKASLLLPPEMHLNTLNPGVQF